MKSKITLITPPDIFENSNPSVFFIHPSDEEQEIIAKWFADRDIPYDINFYVYTNETNAVWFLYALNRSEYKYMNVDKVNTLTQALSGYVLTRNNVFYRTENQNLAGIYTHINGNRVGSIDQFLESILGAKTSEPEPQL
jgi:hypothetical protein